MLSECADRIADVLSNNRIIKSKDKEIYVYGLDALMSTFINLMIIATLGIVLGVFWETVIFMLAFAVLRIFAGGYHAKTRIGCAAASTSAYLISMALYYFTPDDLSKILALVLALISTVSIFVLAPIEHKNRPYEGDEYKRFKKISRIVTGLEALIVFIGIVIIPINYHLLYCISLAMINVVLILALAKKIEVRGE